MDRPFGEEEHDRRSNDGRAMDCPFRPPHLKRAAKQDHAKHRRKTENEVQRRQPLGSEAATFYPIENIDDRNRHQHRPNNPEAEIALDRRRSRNVIGAEAFQDEDVVMHDLADCSSLPRPKIARNEEQQCPHDVRSPFQALHFDPHDGIAEQIQA